MSQALRKALEDFFARPSTPRRDSEERIRKLERRVSDLEAAPAPCPAVRPEWVAPLSPFPGWDRAGWVPPWPQVWCGTDSSGRA